YDDAAKQRALLERMLPQLRAIPGVRGVSPVVAVPFAGAAAWDGRPAAEGQSSEEAAANPMLNMDVVTPDYFKTLGIPVLRGRGFTDADRAGAPLVVVVSQSAARHYWGTDDPIGRRLWNGADLKRAVTVVGVFGAMAAMVRQRRRELGVRMALGATAGDLRGMVMRRGLTIAAVGSVLGVFGALLANRLLVTLLYDVTPTDLATLTAVTAL